MAYYLVNHEYMSESNLLDEIQLNSIEQKGLGIYKDKEIYADSQVNGLVLVTEDQLAQKSPGQTMEEIETDIDGDEIEFSLEIAGKHYKEKFIYETCEALADSTLDHKQHVIESKKEEFARSARSAALNSIDYTKALRESQQDK